MSPRPAFRVQRQPPLASQVFDALRAMMQAQEFEPGERMVEEDLVRRLQVSRTPVREALFRLEQNGLVEQRDGGFRIPRLTRRDVREIFQIRRLLEPQAVAGIVPGMTEQDLARYVAARDRALLAETAEASAAANLAFRSIWLAAIDNRRMHDLLLRYDDQVVLVRHATLHSPEARATAAHGMSDLVAAFAARDPQAARLCMERFIDAALDRYETALPDSDIANPETDP